MDHQEAAEAYRSSAIENAPPIKIIRMLYQGAINYLAKAIQEDAKDPKSQFLDLVHRSEDIVCELRLALNHEHNLKVSTELESLYLFIESQHLKACAERDTKHLEGARKVLITLLDAWTNVELTTAKSV